MPGRTSVNKRQREMQRKERQAEKLSRRDERRVRRNVVPGDAPLAPEIEANSALDSVDNE